MQSTSRSRSSGREPEDPSRTQVIAPMSERQQLALVMQISSQDALPAVPTSPSPPPPPEEKKRTRNQRTDRGESTHSMNTLKSDHDQLIKLYESSSESRAYVDNVRTSHTGRSRDDNSRKGGNASSTSENHKRTKMDSLAQGEHFDAKDSVTQDKGTSENRDEGKQLSSGVVSSTQDDIVSCNKKQYTDDNQDNDAADEEGSKRKKRKDNDDKEPMGKPAPVARGGAGRMVTGSKPPGPASKTGGSSAGKGGQNSGKGSSSGKGAQGQGKGSAGAKKERSGSSRRASSWSGKSSGSKANSQGSKQDRKSPVASPKPNSGKDDGDSEEQKSETAAPKVPPLKIVIPGGGSANRNEQEGSSGQRGSGKGRGSAATLPYVIPYNSNDTGQTSDSSDGNCEDKRVTEGVGKAGQRVLRSHRTNDGEKDKERCSPQTGSDSRSGQSQSALNSNKSPTPSGSARHKGHDDHSGSGPVELHPRKRKIKASKDSHSRESKNDQSADTSSASHNITHSNPYQMYIHIRKQIDRRQRSLFPVKPKPPKDFNKYLMNRCTYTLQSNVNPEPQIEIPVNLPPQMVTEFVSQEKERTRLRLQHLVEKEKLVLAVEQEILRVHGRAERAVANQALPFSVCTMLRDNEVYNVLAPEQEEKRNAQRSRCNGRQINSWLQEVDDKWEKIKVGMLRRQHTEAETLHAVQTMGWEWKMKEFGICDYKTTPKIDPTHVPQIHVSNFDLPA